MTLKSIKILILFLLFYSSAQAQTFKITGVVKDKKETLPGASIYLASTKIATSTNSEGKFTIGNLAPGNYDLLVQLIGYLPFSKSITITNQSVDVDVLLKENVTTLNEVVIKIDPNRQQYINLFKSHFIGNSGNAKDCKILNPDLLIADYDKQERLLTISSTDFLIIENKALGYRLKYLLKTFELDQKTNIVYYEGYPFFEDIKGSKSKHKKWQKARDLAYYGSKQEFLQSLYHNTVKQNGYIINKMVEIANSNRLPDSLINANVKRLSATNSGLTALTFTRNDSLAIWLRERNKPRTLNVLNRAEVSTDTLVKTYNQNLKYIDFSDKLYVIYTKETEPDNFTFSGYRVSRPMDMPNYQISMLSVLSGPVMFYANGEWENPRSALLQGFWSYEKIPNALPINYKPN